MPTASSFSWTFPWAEFVGGWNAFMRMFNTPIAIAGAIGVAFMVVTFVVSLFRRRG